VPKSQPLVEVRDVELSFDGGRVRALNGASLAVHEGEFLALTGPSGCGKSSLLNVIGTLEAPHRGELRFRGRPYAELGDPAAFRRRRLGFVFQSFHLLPTLTALENVLVATLGNENGKRESAERAGALLAGLGLGARFGHLPAELSGGERQRVALARALVNDPELLLADEPTGSLDSETALEVLDLIERARRERGCTVLMVTHDTGVSARADRVVRLRDGRVDAVKEAA
jgi:putative ABC transport system ATP-binding protein